MLDIQAVKTEYERLVVLSQTDNVAAANQAVAHYAQTMPAMIEEIIRLQNQAAGAVPHLTTTDDLCTID